jgi:NhaA family Na+:H+ antiporter
MPLHLFREFIKLESASGILLFGAMILALILANSPLYPAYDSLFNSSFIFELSHWHFRSSLNVCINDGLMTIFFLLVSLEIKRELIQGELNSRKKALLPLFAALGGMILPAIIYIVINLHHPYYLRGWAIPTATDIAFSLAILNFLGSRVPPSLKAFLTALAIIDDLGAIIIIATLYSSHIAFIYLLFAAIALMILLLLNYCEIQKFFPYAIAGFLLWFFLLKSGVHATIAGVLLGFTIPKNLLPKLEHHLHPWVAYAILPLFALANAGLSLTNIHLSTLSNTLSLGVFCGLFFGKQFGVFASSWLAIKTKIASLPRYVNWKQFYGACIICGIGFTMSLFIGNLAFTETHSFYSDLVKLGVITGSLLSGLIGYLILRY